MKRKEAGVRSTQQKVSNRGKERGLSRDDALTAYAMDRLLYRLGRSSQTSEFFLKGGLLIANLLNSPHRFTRDIDLLRSHGPTDPDEIRGRFREIVSVKLEDGIVFDPDGVRAVKTERNIDEYDGVKVFVRASIGDTELEVRIDIGFGDDVVPPVHRVKITPFLSDDPPAQVLAYAAAPVIAEKVETLISKFPAIQHRLKDILDVMVLSNTQSFDGLELAAALRATFERRGTRADTGVLREMKATLVGRKWETGWSAMLKDKAVQHPPQLADALLAFERFISPILTSLNGGKVPSFWQAGGPWDI